MSKQNIKTDAERAAYQLEYALSLESLIITDAHYNDGVLSYRFKKEYKKGRSAAEGNISTEIAQLKFNELVCKFHNKNFDKVKNGLLVSSDVVQMKIELSKNFMKKDIFLSGIKNRQAYKKKCMNCGVSHSHTSYEYIAIIYPKEGLNQFVCRACAEYLISIGAENMEEKREKDKKIKEEIIAEMRGLFGNITPKYEREILQMSVEKAQFELQSSKEYLKEQQDYEKMVESEFVATPTEDYLKEQYNVYEHESLRHDTQIGSHFKSFYSLYKVEDRFQYSQDPVTVLVKIGNKFYDVFIYYWWSEVEGNIHSIYKPTEIEKIEYRGREKPQPKEQMFSISVIANEKDFGKITAYLEQNGVEFTINTFYK